MSKKRLFVFLSLVMVLSMALSACAPAATPAPVTEAPKATDAPKTEAPAVTEAAKTEAPAATEVKTEAPKTEAPAAGGKSTLVYVETGSYYTLDPFVTPWHAYPQYAVYATLVTLKPDLSGYAPYLAESWEVSKDNKQITLHIRKDAKFQDGSPVNAEAIKWNFDMYMDEKLASPQGGSARDNVEKTEVVDEYTVLVTLKNPYAPFFNMIGDMEIVSKTAYEKEGADNFGKHPIGAGPWKPVTITENVSIVYDAFKDYAWNPEFYDTKGPVKFDQLAIKYITDESVIYAALETGEIQLAGIAPQFLEKARANPNIEIVEGLNYGITYLGFNNELELLKDIKVRQAIGYAINREELVQVGYEGEALPTYSALSPSEIGSSPEAEEYSKKTSDDVEKAKALLDEAGWKLNGTIREKDGKKLEFVMSVSNSPVNQRMGETIQNQLAEVGIGIKMESVESTIIKEKTVKGTHELILWNYALIDPMILTYIFDSSRIGASNRNRVNDPELDKLLRAADQELDPVKRNANVLAAMNYLTDKRYHIPLLTVKSFTGYRKDLIKNVKFDKLGGALLNDAEPIK